MHGAWRRRPDWRNTGLVVLVRGNHPVGAGPGATGGGSRVEMGLSSATHWSRPSVCAVMFAIRVAAWGGSRTCARRRKGGSLGVRRMASLSDRRDLALRSARHRQVLRESTRSRASRGARVVSKPSVGSWIIDMPATPPPNARAAPVIRWGACCCSVAHATSGNCWSRRIVVTTPTPTFRPSVVRAPRPTVRRCHIRWIRPSRICPGRSRQTPEWTAWSATMRPAPLEGTWLLSGYEVGRGALYGRLTVTKVKGASTMSSRRAPCTATRVVGPPWCAMASRWCTRSPVARAFLGHGDERRQRVA